MDSSDVTAYLARGWTSAERLKQQYWAEEFARRGPAATLEASAALWEHARLVHPDWPSDEQRAEDLAHHQRLKALIDRAAGGLIALAAR